VTQRSAGTNRAAIEVIEPKQPHVSVNSRGIETGRPPIEVSEDTAREMLEAVRTRITAVKVLASNPDPVSFLIKMRGHTVRKSNGGDKVTLNLIPPRAWSFIAESRGDEKKKKEVNQFLGIYFKALRGTATIEAGKQISQVVETANTLLAALNNLDSQ
jgi:hypothetical protein